MPYLSLPIYFVFSYHHLCPALHFQFYRSLPPSLLCSTITSMASPSSAQPSSATGFQNRKRSLGFIGNAKKHKHSFIQFFAMTGILLLSVRSLGQKYRLHDLREDTVALRADQESLVERMNNIKRALFHEASSEPTGLFASRLRLLFGEDRN